MSVVKFLLFKKISLVNGLYKPFTLLDLLPVWVTVKSVLQ
nr:MAG TPA: hypothetical protein [Caudoviricetes sp.]